jgi:hypothetical protein
MITCQYLKTQWPIIVEEVEIAGTWYYDKKRGEQWWKQRAWEAGLFAGKGVVRKDWDVGSSSL